MTSATTTSPKNTSRHDTYVVAAPPSSGPTATAMALAAAMRPYARGRPSGGKLPAASATTAGMMSAAPTPSRKDRPTMRIVRLGARPVVAEPAA